MIKYLPFVNSLFMNFLRIMTMKILKFTVWFMVLPVLFGGCRSSHKVVQTESVTESETVTREMTREHTDENSKSGRILIDRLLNQLDLTFNFERYDYDGVTDTALISLDVPRLTSDSIHVLQGTSPRHITKGCVRLKAAGVSDRTVSAESETRRTETDTTETLILNRYIGEDRGGMHSDEQSGPKTTGACRVIPGIIIIILLAVAILLLRLTRKTRSSE